MQRKWQRKSRRVFKKRKVRKLRELVTAQRGLLIKEEREGGKRGSKKKEWAEKKKKEREKWKYSNWKLFRRPRKIIENVHAVCELWTEEGRGGVISKGNIKGGKGVNPFVTDDIYTCNTSVICGWFEGSCHVQPTDWVASDKARAAKGGGEGGRDSSLKWSPLATDKR